MDLSPPAAAAAANCSGGGRGCGASAAMTSGRRPRKAHRFGPQRCAAAYEGGLEFRLFPEYDIYIGNDYKFGIELYILTNMYHY